jgi:hypothetical protein
MDGVVLKDPTPTQSFKKSPPPFLGILSLSVSLLSLSPLLFFDY